MKNIKTPMNKKKSQMTLIDDNYLYMELCKKFQAFHIVKNIHFQNIQILAEHDLAYLHFTNCKFENVSFSTKNNSYFNRIVFDKCTFKGTKFDYDVKFKRPSFKYCKFENSKLGEYRYENLYEPEFINPKYSKSDYFMNDLLTSFCILPEGDLIGYKKIRHFTPKKETSSRAIVKLFIPKHAKRVSGWNRKCRASEAKVIYIQDIKTGKFIKEGFSSHDNDFIYKVGEVIKPQIKFDPDPWIECTSGIHFFITRKEAEQY